MFDPVIIGLGETQVGSLPGFTPWEIQAEAVRRAVRDAGLEKGDVDGLINSPPYSRPHQMFSLEMVEYLGLRPKISLTMDIGGTATALTMVETAGLAGCQVHRGHSPVGTAFDQIPAYEHLPAMRLRFDCIWL